jgi:hypothetical protein
LNIDFVKGLRKGDNPVMTAIELMVGICAG